MLGDKDMERKKRKNDQQSAKVKDWIRKIG